MQYCPLSKGMFSWGIFASKGWLWKYGGSPTKNSVYSAEHAIATGIGELSVDAIKNWMLKATISPKKYSQFL